jgi:hypothetical protein
MSRRATAWLTALLLQRSERTILPLGELVELADDGRAVVETGLMDQADMPLYALVPVPPPGTARDAVLRDAIAIGAGAELLRTFFNCDAVEHELADQQMQTAEVANRIADAGGRLLDQVEALTVRADKLRRLDAQRKADKARRDAEAAAEAREAEVAAYLDAEPEPGGHAPEPSLASEAGEAEVEPTPFDAGLSELGPVEHERYRAGDAEGDLPPELTKKVPVEPGNYFEPDPEALGGPPDPHQVPQPVSISLNEARP